MAGPRTLDSVFRLCLRQRFTPDHQALVVGTAGVNWQQLYQLSVRHRVAPLIFQNLRACGWERLGIGADLRLKFQMACSASLAAFHRRRGQATEALRLFQSLGCRVLLLKAVALEDRVYQPPWLTTPGDSDLLVDRRWDGFSRQEQDRIQSFASEHTEVELDFFEHEDLNDCGILPVDFAEVWSRVTPTAYGGEAAFLPCDTDQLVALCVNACRKRFLLGKSLLDLSEFLTAANGVDWEELTRRARRWRTSYICFAALRLAQRLLGAPVPDKLADLLGLPASRGKLLTYLTDSGFYTRHASVHSGRRFLYRRVNPSLLLPYAVQQGTTGRRLRFVWRSIRHQFEKPVK